MSTTFRPYEPDQMLLLPADLREWLPEGHLAHHDQRQLFLPVAEDGIGRFMGDGGSV